MIWECISIDFVIGLPTIAGYDYVYVVVDMLTKVAHLMPVKTIYIALDISKVFIKEIFGQPILLQTTYTASDISRVFIKEIFRFHGLPKRIVSDRDAKFTSKFWTSLFQAIGTQLCFSTTYHPQIDWQTRRVNQVIEDIFKAYCLQEPRKWVQHLPLVEYAYNSFDHRSIGMSPFKALYKQECIAPLNFLDPTIKVETSKQMLDEMEAQTKAIRKDIQAAQDRQKHYGDKDKSERIFKLGNRVVLRVKPKQSNLSLGKFKKLSPKYCRPYEIVKVVKDQEEGSSICVLTREEAPWDGDGECTAVGGLLGGISNDLDHPKAALRAGWTLFLVSSSASLFLVSLASSHIF
ncbi:hypothetical protein L7F22_060647 [Adiantum nelumboides]|nr:hypothetical protein [Adiantum nelumboides]